MWLYDYISRALAFTLAYVRVLGASPFDFTTERTASKSVFGKFYWVSLFVCAFAIFYLFDVAHQYEPATSGEDDLNRCFPQLPMPFLAFFIFAEIASFVLLVGARCAAFVVVRIWPAGVIVPQGVVYSTSQKSNIIFRRLYRLMWGWFPITLVIALFISENRLHRALEECARAGPSILTWLLPVIWPGFVGAFALIIAVNWLLFKWQLTGRLMFLLVVTLVSYVLALGIVSPSDSLLVDGLRNLPQQLPEQIKWIATQLFGVKLGS